MPDSVLASRVRLRWLTIVAPLLVLICLGALHFAVRPEIPPMSRAVLIVGVTLIGVAALLFSRFVFGRVQRQEAELLRQTRQLAEDKEAVAIVEERQRIARELHDSVAQTLGYLHLQLAAAEQQMAEGDVARVAEALPALRRTAREAYAEAREAIFGLRGMASRTLGLIPGLAEYLEDWSRQTGVPVDLQLSGLEDLPVSPVVEVQIIGIIQEAMANVRKHARASRAWVELTRNGNSARLSVTDDGAGFDPALLEARRTRSFGMAMMRERAEGVGATLAVSSMPGRGASVEIAFPLQPAEPVA